MNKAEGSDAHAKTAADRAGFTQIADSEMLSLLESVRKIALIGASPNAERPSNEVMGFLLAHGYVVYPVNPGQAGREIHGQLVYAKLSDIPEPIDMVDVFRSSDAVSGIVDEMLELSPLPAVLWTQLGVYDEDAGIRAQKAGIRVIMDHCPKIEYRRLIK